MAYLTKTDVRQIIQNAPPGLDPAKIVQSLANQGNILQGYNDTPQSSPSASPQPQAQTQAQTQSQPQGFWGKVGAGIGDAFHAIKETAVGGAKGITSTVDNASQLGQAGLNAITSPFGLNQPVSKLPYNATHSTNTQQGAGFLGSQIGQGLVGGGAASGLIGDATRGIPEALPGLAGRAAQLGAQAAGEGVAGAGMAKLQGASNQGAGTVGAISSTLPFVGAGMKAISPALAEFLHLTTGGKVGTQAAQDAINNPEAIGGALKEITGTLPGKLGVTAEAGIGDTGALDKVQQTVPAFRKALTASYDAEKPAVLQALGDTKITLPSTTIQDLMDAKQIAKKLDVGPLQAVLDAQDANFPITMSADTLARNAGKTLIPPAELTGEEALNLYHDVNNAISKYGLSSGPEGVPIRDFRDYLKSALLDASGGKGGAVDQFLTNYSNKKQALDLLDSVVNAYDQGNAKAQQSALSALRSAYSNGNEEIVKALKAFEAQTGMPISHYAAAMQFEKVLPEGGGGLLKSIARGLAGVVTSPRGAGAVARNYGRLANVLDPAAKAIKSVK